MTAYTATGAYKEKTTAITFKSQEHRDFYMKSLMKCRYQDVYHKHWCTVLESTEIHRLMWTESTTLKRVM